MSRCDSGVSCSSITRESRAHGSGGCGTAREERGEGPCGPLASFGVAPQPLTFSATNRASAVVAAAATVAAHALTKIDPSTPPQRRDTRGAVTCARWTPRAFLRSSRRSRNVRGGRRGSLPGATGCGPASAAAGLRRRRMAGRPWRTEGRTFVPQQPQKSARGAPLASGQGWMGGEGQRVPRPCRLVSALWLERSPTGPRVRTPHRTGVRRRRSQTAHLGAPFCLPLSPGDRRKAPPAAAGASGAEQEAAGGGSAGMRGGVGRKPAPPHQRALIARYPCVGGGSRQAPSPL